MFAGRFLVIVPVLCIAGNLAAKKTVPASAGTLPTGGMQFVGLLIGTVVIVGGLTFLPALALGPVAEHFAIQGGMTYGRALARQPFRSSQLIPAVIDIDVPDGPMRHAGAGQHPRFLLVQTKV
jgi:hypothetical protein